MILVMQQGQADQIIAQLERDYDTIADHFAQTRQHPWAEFGSLKALIEHRNVETTLGLSLLDVGCGNGRLAEMLIKIKGVHYTGLDLSSQLLELAKQRYPQHQFVHGSILKLPFANQQFNVVTCVATLQHIPSLAYRQQAIREMTRVLKPGGIVFMMNWNLADQPHYQTYLTNPADGYDAGDYLIPWKDDRGKIMAQRYYHGFKIAELTELTENAELKILQNALGVESRNIVTIASSLPSLSTRRKLL